MSKRYLYVSPEK
ncbi:unnamed protein product, partial [Allacma fusca]